MKVKEAIELLKRATMFEPTLENRDYPEAFDLAIKALEERTQCEKCTYRIFTEKFVNNISEVMALYGITSVEELQERLQAEMKGKDNQLRDCENCVSCEHFGDCEGCKKDEED